MSSHSPPLRIEPIKLPWLSILVPVFDVKPYLDACIASILGQGIDGVEVLFVDDASCNGEAAMLAAWQLRYPNHVRIVTHEINRGIGASRNTLLDNSRGEYLWFVDSDDLMTAGSVQSLRDALATQRPDLIICDFCIFRDFRTPSVQATGFQGGRRNRQRKRDLHVATFVGPTNVLSNNRDELIFGLFSKGRMHPWSKIIRSAAWKPELRFIENRFFEDLALFPRLALTMKSFIYFPQVWIVYRQRPGSILNSPSITKLDDWMFALAGYGQALRSADFKVSNNTMFAVADFCTRAWRNCIRAYRSQPEAAKTAQVFSRLRSSWMNSLPMNISELKLAYLKRGQLHRWWQMRALLGTAKSQFVRYPFVETKRDENV